MKLLVMINANFFLGEPVKFKNICDIYSPKIKDILKEKNYPIYKKLLMDTQEDIEDEYVKLKLPIEEMPTPYENLFLMSEANEEVESYIKKAFEFFIHEPISLFKKQRKIIIGSLEDLIPSLRSIKDLRILSEEDFFDFQNLLRQSVGEKQAEPYDPFEHPKVKYFKAKARERDRVKAKNSKDGLTLGATLASICCMNFGLNPLNIGELTQYSISVLIRYFQEKEKYDTDIKSLLAGASSDKVKPQNWIRNIEDL